MTDKDTDKQAYKIGFVGLGVMGHPMAGHLAAAGHAVTVFNRTEQKANQWLAEHSGQRALTPKGAGVGADYVFVCVGNDEDVRQVVLAPEGVLAAMPKGALLIDHTTASAELATELGGACARKGVGFLDAPVSGGQVGAVNGQLTVMVGGDSGDFERARPVMECYAKAISLMGLVGAGQLTKMVNQICIAGVLQGLSEGIALAQRSGLDVPNVVDVIAHGAAQSWQMENRALTMAQDQFDFGFAVDWMRKDLAIALTKGRELGVRMPLTALVDDFYADVQANGGGRWDTSSLISRLRPKP